MLAPDLQVAVCALVVGGMGLLFTLVFVRREDRSFKKMLLTCGIAAAAGLAYLAYKLML